ncbi:hypothetical protein Scep_030100 [Stephania cephalantha]|uniref:Uncharacterized protein n=1 Tax=Stephania cephalantha TaxID=152367 RepID=A0AAP0DYX4_9MAGN
MQMKGFADGLAMTGSLVSIENLISNCLIGLDIEFLSITSSTSKAYSSSHLAGISVYSSGFREHIGSVSSESRH